MSTGALLRAERQFRLSLLSSRLDIAKARSILHRSLDAQAANERDPTFLKFFHQGKVLLLYALGCHFASTPIPPAAIPALNATPIPARTDGTPSSADIPMPVCTDGTPPAADIASAADRSSANDVAGGGTSAGATATGNSAAFGLGKRSKLLESVVKACVVDDVNLAAAFDALRVEELLEGCYQAPPIELCSAIVLAILGELHALRQTLSEYGGLEARPTVEFIERTLQQFTSLLIETGRDRYTYIKESLVSSILTPPRPCLGQKPAEDRAVKEALTTQDSFALAGLLEEDFDWPYTLRSGVKSLLLGLYNKGDSQLEVLLASGTVLSLLRRLQLLQQKNGPEAVDLIRFAILRQAPLLNTLRQLMLTRVMEALACPLGRTDADERARAAVGSAASLEACRLTLQILADALLDCGVPAWCYETDAQRSAICSKGLPPYCGRRLSQVLCIKVSRSMLDSPGSWELPEADVLSKHFLGVCEGVSRPPLYTQMFFSQQPLRPDSNSGAEGSEGNKPCRNLHGDSRSFRQLAKGVPRAILLGTPEVRSTTYSLVASRLLRTTPDFFTAGAVDEVRFFRSPLLVAFKDTKTFKQTLGDFFVVKDIEEEPAMWGAVGRHY